MGRTLQAQAVVRGKCASPHFTAARISAYSTKSLFRRLFDEFKRRGWRDPPCEEPLAIREGEKPPAIRAAVPARLGGGGQSPSRRLPSCWGSRFERWIAGCGNHRRVVLPEPGCRNAMKVLVSDTSALVDPERLPTAHVGPGTAATPGRHALAHRLPGAAPDIRPGPPVLLTLEFQATVDRHMAPARGGLHRPAATGPTPRGSLGGAEPGTAPRPCRWWCTPGASGWSAPLSVQALTAPGPEAITPLQPDRRLRAA